MYRYLYRVAMFTVIPAIDLREGKCVRLTKGVIGTETLYYENPVDAIRYWMSLGAKTIHIVDLDAATGIGSNKPLIKSLAAVAGSKAMVQVGGGIRDIDTAREYVDAGVARIVLGTAAVKNPSLVKKLSADIGSDRLIVALDHKQGTVRVKGWTEDSGKDVHEMGRTMADHGAGFILLSAVEADGAFTGPDVETTRAFIQRVEIPVLAAGGTRNLEDIAVLRDAGAAGVVIGKALYEGRIDLASALHFNIF